MDERVGTVTVTTCRGSGGVREPPEFSLSKVIISEVKVIPGFVQDSSLFPSASGGVYSAVIVSKLGVS